MAVKAWLFRDYEKNFMLDETKLRKIIEVLRDYSEKLKENVCLVYTVEREDNSMYETKNIDEILSEDNSPEKVIMSLTVELKKDIPENNEEKILEKDRRPVVVIQFNRNNENKVRIMVSGEERDWCYLLTDALDAQIKRVLKSKVPSFLLKRRFDFVAFASLFIFLAGLFLFNIRGIPPLFSANEISAMTSDDRLTKVLEIMVKRDRYEGIFVSASMLFALILIIVLVEVRPLSRLIEQTSKSVFYWGGYDCNT